MVTLPQISCLGNITMKSSALLDNKKDLIIINLFIKKTEYSGGHPTRNTVKDKENSKQLLELSPCKRSHL